MNRAEIIQNFLETVNKGLSEGKDFGELAYQELSAVVTEASDQRLLQQIRQAYHLAAQPVDFFNHSVQAADARLEQCYELMRITFSEAERESRERYMEVFSSLKDNYYQAQSIPVMMGRFWHASGPQTYDTSGYLGKFDFNPLLVTDGIVSVASGSYMRMEVPQGSGETRESIGAIGHAATVIRFRRGQGHGSAVLDAFEREVGVIAANRGERLRLIILEAQTESIGFWAKHGYRWPAGTRYFQPPLDFDPITGERFYDEVPELLMVKLCDNPSATHIDQKLLMDAVRTIYTNWCLAKVATYTPAAVQQATEYVFGKVFAGFVASLPPGGEPVPLQVPPGI